MGETLQEQLKRLGLIKKEEAEAKKREKHQQLKANKAKKNAPPPIDENALLALAAQKKKAERAQELNRQREEKLRRRQEAARAEQLIAAHALPKPQGGVAFRFVDAKKIFRVFVEKEVVAQLSVGKAAIVRQGEGYLVIPAAIARQLREINPALLAFFNENSAEKQDDPYAEYAVPDDLDW
ncbi:MAG: DUF2058 domain-containing protein [Desulfobulbaceae bacterium]|jgi:uncharacterized protein YaiL (DUF2058 family)|nr:DUF2058 domain-containing protein [Desulfobulbaceae bacterium]